MGDVKTIQDGTNDSPADIIVAVNSEALLRQSRSVREQNRRPEIHRDEVEDHLASRHNTAITDLPYRRKLFDTFGLWALFFGVGLFRSQEGVAFLDLLLIVDTNIDTGSLLQTLSNLGYLLGSVLSGHALEKFHGDVICFVCCFATGIFSVAIPYSRQLLVMAAVMFTRSLFAGIVVSGGIFLCSNIWREKANPYLQALLFIAAFGGVISPFITEAYLLSNKHNTTLAQANTISEIIYGHQELAMNVSAHGQDVRTNTNISANMTLAFEPCTSEVHFAFIIVGSYFFLVSFPFLAKLFSHRTCTLGSNSIEPRSSTNHSYCRNILPVFSCLSLFTYASIGAIFFAYGCIEKTCAIFLMPFVVDSLHWNKLQGSRIVALFWGTFAFGRLIGILEAKFITVTKMILLDLILIASGFVGIAFGAHESDVLMWIFTAVAGMGMSSFYISVAFWIGQTVTPMTRKLTAFCFSSFSTGIMVQLSLLGYVFEHSTTMWFAYFPLFFIGICNLGFVSIHLVGRSIGKQRLALEVDHPADSASV